MIGIHKLAHTLFGFNISRDNTIISIIRSFTCYSNQITMLSLELVRKNYTGHKCMLLDKIGWQRQLENN